MGHSTAASNNIPLYTLAQLADEFSWNKLIECKSKRAIDLANLASLLQMVITIQVGRSNWPNQLTFFVDARTSKYPEVVHRRSETFPQGRVHIFAFLVCPEPTTLLEFVDWLSAFRIEAIA